MAKLNQTQQKKVDSASDSFEPLPADAYHVRLVDVDATREGPKGPYWSWEFEVVEPGDYENRKLWNNTSLSKEAAFSFKQTFAAFGVESDTDTDDLCGQVVKAVVSIRTIQEGARKGDQANQIDRLVPADPDFEAPEAEKQPDAEDIFS